MNSFLNVTMSSSSETSSSSSQVSGGVSLNVASGERIAEPSVEPDDREIWSGSGGEYHTLSSRGTDLNRNRISSSRGCTIVSTH